MPVTETYYETEYRTEYYTATESVAKTVSGEDKLTPKKVEVSPSISPPNNLYSFYSGYQRPYDPMQVTHETRRITYETPKHDTFMVELTFYSPNGATLDFFDCDNYSPRSQFRDDILGNIWGDQEELLPKETKVFIAYNPGPQFAVEIHYSYSKLSSGTPSVQAKVIWTDTVGTENKEVTKERQVPVQVEKQRTVMQTIKVPFWEVIFDK